MARQATAAPRQRRERGSIDPDDIISGAFELASELGIDNLSMPLLSKHLDVGVTSLYWYFRRKDDLINAMSDRALRQYVFSTPYIEAEDWRQTLRIRAHTMRRMFITDPILCDLILIRSAISPRAAKLGVLEVEKVISHLVEAGLSPEEAFDTYSAMTVHVRGSVVLQRLREKKVAANAEHGEIEEKMTIDREATPLLAQVTDMGHHIGVADERNFDFGIECILDHASRLIEERRTKPAARKPVTSPAARPAPERATPPRSVSARTRTRS